MDINDDRIMERLFEEDATKTTYQRVVKIALAKEAAVKEHSEKTNQEMVTVKTEIVNYSRYEKLSNKNQRSEKKIGANRQGSKSEGERNSDKCGVCGRSNHAIRDCVFRNCVCYRCGLKGHLAPVCKKKRSSHHFLEQPEVDSEDYIFNLSILDDSGNVQPT